MTILLFMIPVLARFALAALRSVPHRKRCVRQAGSQFRGLATTIHEIADLARIFHESPATTTNMSVLPGVLGCRTLRRTVQVRLGSNPAVRLPGGTAISTVSRRKFMKHPG